MSLDVYLTIPGAQVKKYYSGIFIRENGSTKEISEEEWYKRHPGRQPARIIPSDETTDVVYRTNITHNLTGMAEEADLLAAIWYPDTIGLNKAAALIPFLQEGLKALKYAPAYFMKFDNKGGWGTYAQFVPFVEGLLQACMKYPEAEISVSR